MQFINLFAEYVFFLSKLLTEEKFTFVMSLYFKILFYGIHSTYTNLEKQLLKKN